MNRCTTSPRVHGWEGAKTPSVCLLAQHVRNQSLRACVRPCANPAPARMSSSVSFDHSEQEGHWFAVLSFKAQARNSDDTLAFEADIEIEAHCGLAAVSPQDIEGVLLRDVLPGLYASCRAILASLTSQAGFGPVTLPPVTLDHLIDMVST